MEDMSAPDAMPGALAARHDARMMLCAERITNTGNVAHMKIPAACTSDDAVQTSMRNASPICASSPAPLRVRGRRRGSPFASTCEGMPATDSYRRRLSNRHGRRRPTIHEFLSTNAVLTPPLKIALPNPPQPI